MARDGANAVLQHLGRALSLRDDVGRTDGELLREYLSHRNESALTTLVRRHAPMVWGVCRRVLRNFEDAEDAFQATFLVLVRKAASIAAPDLLANWLYGVAHQTSLKARATAAKRAGHERHVVNMPEPAAMDQGRWCDLEPLLDRELSRLPDKYRTAIVLCDLAGKTRGEAAQQLGVPEGTLGARVARGRALLARRLARRGVTVSASALSAALGQQAASAGAPALLVSSAIQAVGKFAAGQIAGGALSARVVALTEGVLQTMYLKKLKMLSVVLLILVGLGTGAGLLLHAAIPAEERESALNSITAPPAQIAAAAKLAPVKGDPQALVDKAIQAHGGADLLTKFKVTQVTWLGVEKYHKKFKMETTIQFPDKFKQVYYEPDSWMTNRWLESVRVLNGKQSWYKYRAAKTWDLQGSKANACQEEMYQACVHRLIDLKDKSFQLTLLGDMNIDGKNTAGLKVASEGHPVIVLNFDKATGLLVKSQVSSFDIRRMLDNYDNVEIEERHFSDYKKIDGIMAPMKQMVYHKDELIRESEVQQISFQEKIDPSIFKKPGK